MYSKKDSLCDKIFVENCSQRKVWYVRFFDLSITSYFCSSLLASYFKLIVVRRKLFLDLITTKIVLAGSNNIFINNFVINNILTFI